jgi:hypothetical protein
LVKREQEPDLDDLSPLRRLFSSDFYLSVYPDVAIAGVDPWHHFSKHGVYEGRMPNSYIDPNYMANLLNLPLRYVLIEAFSKKVFWPTNTSPYVDIQGFILSGLWDGDRHPLEQIITEGLNREPWVKYSTAFSDLSSVTEKNQRLVALSILDHVNVNKKTRFSRPKEYILSETFMTDMVFEDEEIVSCIPGFTLATQGVSYPLSNSNDVLSSDKSAIRYGGKLSIYECADLFSYKSLLIAPKHLRYNEGIRWIKTLEPNCAVVPQSSDQEFLLRHCLSETRREDLKILTHGVQSLVACRQIHTSPEFKKKPRRVLRTLDRLPRGPLAVLAESTSEILKNRSQVSKLVSRGAKICISDNQTVPYWLDYLSRQRAVILCGSITWADMWIKANVPIIEIDEWS